MCGIGLVACTGASTQHISTAGSVAEFETSTAESETSVSHDLTPAAIPPSESDDRDLAIGEVIAIEYSPNGEYFATVGGDIRLFETTAFMEVWRVTDDAIPGVLKALAFSPDSTILAVGGADYEVLLLEVATGAIIERTTEKQGEANRGGLAWLPDGNLLALDTRLWVGLFSTSTWTRQTLVTLPGSSYGIALSNDRGQLLVTQATHGLTYSISSLLEGEDTGEAVNWQSDSLDETRLQPYHPYEAKYSPDRSFVAISGTWGILVFNVADGRHVATLNGGSGHVWSPDGRKIAGMDAYGKGTLHIWDAFTGSLLWMDDKTLEKVCSLAWSPDGGTIAISQCNGVVFVSPPE